MSKIITTKSHRPQTEQSRLFIAKQDAYTHRCPAKVNPYNNQTHEWVTLKQHNAHYTVDFDDEIAGGIHALMHEGSKMLPSEASKLKCEHVGGGEKSATRMQKNFLFLLVINEKSMFHRL